MTLIASISGIRGTIGGESGNNLTPIDIVKFTAAYGQWLTARSSQRKIVVGRDGRPSGLMVESLVTATLVGLGFDVVNLGLSTTPTVEMAVTELDCAGGIVITASHNPKEWNALKLLNSKGEFLTKQAGGQVLEIIENDFYSFALVDNLGTIVENDSFWKRHIELILALPLVDAFAVENAKLKILVDGVNSSGGIYVPRMLRAMGVEDIVMINCEPNGQFAHNPEPLAKNLVETCAAIKQHGCDLGIVVDPDVDRLVFIDENGVLFGEEYTLVAVADYVLANKPGVVVSNLSSSRALRDMADRYGCKYYASAVGEVNVTEIMKRFDAVIGGEGNGGIILPDLHYGRDALVGIALFLSHLVKSKMTCSELRATYPDYYMSKQKADLSPDTDVDAILARVAEDNEGGEVNTVDGVKIDFEDSWVHMRKSNTEPIIRFYSEAKTQAEADALANRFVLKVSSMA
jgi:phosphomannomutase